jgi:hypothetical protein
MAKNEEQREGLNVPRSETTSGGTRAGNPQGDQTRDRAVVAQGRPEVLTGGSDPLSQRTMKVDEVVRAPDTYRSEEVPVHSFEEINDRAVRDLLAITGRNVADLALRRGGEVLPGQMTLYAVHDLKRKVLVLSGAKVPEGLWVPANHLPMALLRALEETDEERAARNKREEEARRS